jgi:hypothetical protein
VGGTVTAVQLLPVVRDLYSHHPEYLYHEPWELIGLLWSLGYTEDLADEYEIAAASDVARQDYPEWWRAA